MSHLLDQVVATFDPVGFGCGTPEHAALGYPATGGLCMPATRDLVVLVRRRLYPVPEEWRYCGATYASETRVPNGTGYPHEAGQGYQYAAALMRPNGFRSAFCEPTRIDIYDVGALITPRLPVWPKDVTAVAIAGGQFRVFWTYDPYGQGGYPADFQVFGGADADSVDYDTALVDAETDLDYVTYVNGQSGYAFTTQAYDDLTPRVFAVRGRNSSGVCERNTIVTDVVISRAAAPAAATITSVRQRRPA